MSRLVTKHISGVLQNQAEVYEWIPGGILVFTHGTHMEITYCSEELCSLLGMTREEIWTITAEGQKIEQLLTERDRIRFQRQMKAAITGKGIVNQNYYFRKGRTNKVSLHVQIKEQNAREGEIPVYVMLCMPVPKEVERYAEIINESSNGVMVADQETDEILFVNERFKEMFDRGDEEAVGRKCYEFTRRYHQSCKECYKYKFRKNHYTAAMDVSYGGNRYYVKRGKLIDWNGRIARVEYLTDETERIEQEWKAEERFKQEQERFSALEQELLAELAYNITTDKLLSHKMKGSMDTEIPVGSNNQYIIDSILKGVPHKEDQKKVQQMMMRENLLACMQRDTSELTLEYQRYNWKQNLIWVSVKMVIVENPYRNEHILYVYVRDITKMKESQQIMEQMLQEDYEEIILIDLESKEVKNFGQRKASGAIYEMMQDRMNQKERKAVYEKYVIEPSPEQLLDSTTLSVIQARLEENSSYLISYTLQVAGEKQRKRVTFSYLGDSRTKIFLVVQDITDVYQEEQRRNLQLEEALKTAREASEAKGEFLSRMSHDIRTPLNGIMGMTSLALDATKDQEVADYLEKINSSGRYLMGLINDILDISKIESGKLELHPEPCDPIHFSSSIRSIIEPMCEVKGVAFQLDFGEKTHRIMADQMRLGQIFLNLLNNAVKFTPEGGIVQFIIEQHEVQGENIQVDFCLSDNGIGMTKEFMEHMYEAFSQEQGAYVRDSETGTGLGLAIVKNLVEIMGGTIQVESAPGKGTTYRIRMTFPLAEDNPINSEITRKILLKYKAEVVTAENGKEVVAIFTSSQEYYFDLILMDICMPVMDGYEATKRIRALERLDAKSVPIIAMTANAYDTDRIASREAGMNEHLSKPVDREAMYQKIVEQIEKNKQEAC